MAKWLVKSEPNVYSIDRFAKDGVTAWEGVRNYQARNFLRAMKIGDEVLFYHSVSEPGGVAGLAKVAKTAYPDPSQFNKKSPYFEAKVTKDKPRWFCPDLKFIKKFRKPLPIQCLRQEKKLAKMILLQRGSRLSVQPVSEEEFKIIVSLARDRMGL